MYVCMCICVSVCTSLASFLTIGDDICQKGGEAGLLDYVGSDFEWSCASQPMPN